MRALIVAAIALAGLAPVLVAQADAQLAAAYASAAHRTSGSANEFSTLGDSLHARGRHREAIAAYERALQLGVPEPRRTALNIARGYAHLDNRKQALRWVQYAAELDTVSTSSCATCPPQPTRPSARPAWRASPRASLL